MSTITTTTARTISRTIARTPTTAPTAGAAIFGESDVSPKPGCIVTREVKIQFKNQTLLPVVVVGTSFDVDETVTGLSVGTAV